MCGADEPLAINRVCAVSLRVLDVHKAQYTIEQEANCRRDRAWLFAGDPGTRVLRLPVSRFSLRPQFRVVWPDYISLSLRAENARFDPDSIQDDVFSVWEIQGVPESKKGSADGSPGGCQASLLDSTVHGSSTIGNNDMRTIQPAADLRPGRLYAFCVNDWRMHEDHGIAALRAAVEASALGGLLSAPLLRLIEGYLGYGPALVRIISSRERWKSSDPTDVPFETLAGFRVFFRLVGAPASDAKSKPTADSKHAGSYQLPPLEFDETPDPLVAEAAALQEAFRAESARGKDPMDPEQAQAVLRAAKEAAAKAKSGSGRGRGSDSPSAGGARPRSPSPAARLMDKLKQLF